MNDVFTLTYPTLPTRLRLLREILGLSREKLAGCLTKRAPGNNVGRIERGVHNPTPRTLARLAQGLGVAPSFLAKGYRTDSGSSPMGWKVDEGFPARLRRVLRDQAVLPEDLAARLAHGCASCVIPVLKGTLRPRPETVVNIAKALGVSAQYLATGTKHEVALNELSPGQRLMLVRHAAQLSRAELAAEAGIEGPNKAGYQMLQMWETGRLRPTFRQFEQVAEALGVSLQFLRGHEGTEPDSLWVREQRLSVAERKILEDFRFMFENGVLTAQDASEFSRGLRKQLMQRLTASAKAA
jgi:transcriptional regulator with XRE-family HTH domain